MNIEELKKEWIGKYCTGEKGKQIFRVLDLHEMPHLKNNLIYAEVDVIFGYHPPHHLRPINRLIQLNNIDEYVKRLEAIMKSAQTEQRRAKCFRSSAK